MWKRYQVFAILLLGASCVAQEAPGSPGWVVISIKEYETLRGKAYPTAPQAEPEATQATLTRIDYDLRIEGAVATGHASLTVDVLRDGWVRVPVPQGLLVR